MGGSKVKEFGPEGWTPEQLEPDSQKGKTFAITGTTAGIGFDGARILLEKGATVVMLNRSVERSQKAKDDLAAGLGLDADTAAQRIKCIKCDLAELQSVREAAAEVKAAGVMQIDALICNAAIAQVLKQTLTADGMESQLAVNHMGHFLLCNLLFDLVAAAGGRIVVVSSNGYKMSVKQPKLDDLNFDRKYTAWDAYCHSKLCQMLFAYELQRRLQKSQNESVRSVTVHVCHPGASKTQLIDRDHVGRCLKCLWACLKPMIAQSAEKGSYPFLMCAAGDAAKLKREALYGPTKRGDTVGPVGENKLEKVALQVEGAQKLWDVSEEKCGCKWEV